MRNKVGKIPLAGKLILVLVIGLLTGVFLLSAVYLLPTGRMKSHVAQSSELFNYEGIYPQIMQGQKSSQLDNYTDALMYATAIHPGSGNPVGDALKNARFEYEGDNMVQSLNDYANDAADKKELRYEMTYSRYWHGYLVILKPLLLFFNVGEIRLLFMILQGILTLMLFYLVLKKIGEHFVLPVILMVTVLNPAVLPLSLQFSWVYFCGLLGAIAVLCMKDPAFRGRYLYLFLSVGMITSYLDLLTYPLITLGLPLVLLLLREQEQSTKARIFLVLKAGVSWVTGYAVMWIGKWILVSTFGQKNIVAEITGKITQRTALVGEGAESLSIDGVLFRNIQVLLKWPYLLAAFLFLVFCIYFRANSGEKKVVGKQFYRGIPYLIIMMIPIMWFVLLANHSWEHYWFTYRELSVSVLAGAVWALEMVVPDEGKGGNETWIK